MPKNNYSNKILSLMKKYEGKEIKKDLEKKEDLNFSDQDEEPS